MNIKDVTALIKAVKADIRDDHRAFEDDECPGIQLTIASTDGKDWGWQTGDNCYTGGAYGYAFWSVEGVYRNTNCRELAAQMVHEIKDTIEAEKAWATAEEEWAGEGT